MVEDGSASCRTPSVPTGTPNLVILNYEVMGGATGIS
jgi:hypothetical protein